MSRLIYFYTKNSLEKASSNPDKFARELKKAIKNLLPYEVEHLNNWLNFFTKERPELIPYLTIVN